MADLFSMLTRLAERQKSVLAGLPPVEASKDKWVRLTLKSQVALDCWTEEEASAIAEGLIRPIVRKWIATSPWQSIGEGESELLEGLRCYTSWHTNLMQAARPDTVSPAGALLVSMRRWIELYSRNEARTHWKKERRSVPIATGTTGEKDERVMAGGGIDISIADPGVKLSDLVLLSDLWASRLTGGSPLPVQPSDADGTPPGKLPRFFLEWMLWQHLPIDPNRRPASLSGFEKWTQQAWAAWRGVANSTAGDLAQKLLVSKNQGGRRGISESKGLFQEFMEQPSPGAEPLTVEEASALILYLQEHFLAWKPEFVLTHSFRSS